MLSIFKLFKGKSGDNNSEDGIIVSYSVKRYYGSERFYMDIKLQVPLSEINKVCNKLNAEFEISSILDVDEILFKRELENQLGPKFKVTVSKDYDSDYIIADITVDLGSNPELAEKVLRKFKEATKKAIESFSRKFITLKGFEICGKYTLKLDDDYTDEVFDKIIDSIVEDCLEVANLPFTPEDKEAKIRKYIDQLKDNRAKLMSRIEKIDATITQLEYILQKVIQN